VILQGAVLVDERVRLPAATHRVGALDTLALYSEDGKAAAAPGPVAPVLDAQTVTEWLTDQSDASREQILAAFTDDIASIRARAHAAGLEEGRALGSQQAAGKLEGCYRLLTSLAERIDQRLESEVNELSEACADIVIEVLTKIAGRALMTRSAVIATTIEVAKRVKSDRELTLRVSAEDGPIIEAERARISEALSGCRLEVLTDHRVQAGGCIVESRHGTFDGRLEVQLRALLDAMQAAKAAGRKNR
jgi:flagellar biosynthesis/type III secretory pathway protein FliH